MAGELLLALLRLVVGLIEDAHAKGNVDPMTAAELAAEAAKVEKFGPRP